MLGVHRIYYASQGKSQTFSSAISTHHLLDGSTVDPSSLVGTILGHQKLCCGPWLTPSSKNVKQMLSCQLSVSLVYVVWWLPVKFPCDRQLRPSSYVFPNSLIVFIALFFFVSCSLWPCVHLSPMLLFVFVPVCLDVRVPTSCNFPRQGSTFLCVILILGLSLTMNDFSLKEELTVFRLGFFLSEYSS